MFAVAAAWGRRTVAVAVVVGFAFVGPSGAASPAAAWFLPHGRVSRPPTAAERRRAATFVAAARRSMTQWADPVTAMRDGYEPASQGPAVHYVNVQRLLAAGQTPDPALPSALVFVGQGNSTRLVGAMWMMASPATPGPDVAGPLAAWHAHTDCRSAWTARLVTVGTRCRPGETLEVTPEMLHVWATGAVDPFASDMSAAALACSVAAGAPVTTGRATPIGPASAPSPRTPAA